MMTGKVVSVMMFWRLGSPVQVSEVVVLTVIRVQEIQNCMADLYYLLIITFADFHHFKFNKFNSCKL